MSSNRKKPIGGGLLNRLAVKEAQKNTVIEIAVYSAEKVKKEVNR
jgi:hypothetical protein